LIRQDDFIDTLLAKIDIVQLIGEYATLTHKGGAVWACCPFHNEKTPSFRIDPRKQFYYCFGSCREGGNAITFIKKIESLDGADAVKFLAKKYGIEIPDNKNFKPKSEEDIAKKTRLYALMKEAAKRYHQNLIGDKGRVAREYLAKRNINETLIKKFGLGYSVNRNDLLNHAKELGYTKDELKDCNLAVINEKGVYDPFFERLIIPIVNQMNEVCAFGGRTMIVNPEFAKYRNSSNTILFEKNRIVFAINLLKKLKKDGGKIDYIILCEGYMDVIALHSAGFNTAVACMGTALTINQAKQLKNFTDTVYISFDGDSAGQKNTMIGLDVLSGVGLNVKVIKLPDGKDPDDVIKTGGAASYDKLIVNALTLTAFKLNTIAKNYNLRDLQQKSKFTQEAIGVIKRIESPVEQAEYFKKLSKLTGYGIDILYRQADKTPITVTNYEEFVPRTIVSNTATNKEENKYTRAEKFILASLANDKPYANYKEKFSELFVDKFAITVANFFVDNKKGENQNVARLYNMVDASCKSELDEILNNYLFGKNDNKAYYDNCVTLLKDKKFDENIASLEKKAKEALAAKDMATMQKYLKQIQELRQEKKEQKENK